MLAQKSLHAAAEYNVKPAQALDFVGRYGGAPGEPFGDGFFEM